MSWLSETIDKAKNSFDKFVDDPIGYVGGKIDEVPGSELFFYGMPGEMQAEFGKRIVPLLPDEAFMPTQAGVGTNLVPILNIIDALAVGYDIFTDGEIDMDKVLSRPPQPMVQSPDVIASKHAVNFDNYVQELERRNPGYAKRETFGKFKNYKSNLERRQNIVEGYAEDLKGDIDPLSAGTFKPQAL